MKFLFAGDSWALKGFTEQNYHYNNNDPMAGDVRLADHWGLEYQYCLTPGRGNLRLLDKIAKMNIDSTTPIVWVYTEPGRDYGEITGRAEFEWIESENIFEIRQQLNTKIMCQIRQTLPNPIGLIGGLSDIDIDLAQNLSFFVIHPSWQQWIANTLNSQWFEFGWGASDIGWRAHHNNVIPSRAATLAWDAQIKEWCWWQDRGYFCHEHPTPRANTEFAADLLPLVGSWIQSL